MFLYLSIFCTTHESTGVPQINDDTVTSILTYSLNKHNIQQKSRKTREHQTYHFFCCYVIILGTTQDMFFYWKWLYYIFLIFYKESIQNYSVSDFFHVS